MSMTSVRPNGYTTFSSPWTVTGAATPQAALSDDSSSSYIGNTSGSTPAMITFPAATIPAGARLISCYLRVTVGTAAANQRASISYSFLTSGWMNMVSGSTLVDWSSPKSINIATIGNAKQVPWGFHIYPPGVVRIHEATAYVSYATAPVVSDIQVLSPLNQSAAPLIGWVQSVDAAGGAVTHQDFVLQRYSGGVWSDVWSYTGFRSSPQIQLGALEDGQYRLRIRIAQTIAGEQHWSAWLTGSPFTLAVAPPAVPTCTPAAEDQLAYVSLRLIENSGPVVNWYEVQSSPDGVNDWSPILTTLGGGRIVNPNPGSGDIIVADYEPPNGAPRYYRCRGLKDNGDGYIAASAWSAVSSGSWNNRYWWIKDPMLPGRNTRVEVASIPGYTRIGRSGVFRGLSSKDVVLVTDVAGPMTGELTVIVDTDIDRQKIDALAGDAAPVLVQSVPGTHWDDRWLVIAEHTREPVVDKVHVPSTLERLTWIEVPRPE